MISGKALHFNYAGDVVNGCYGWDYGGGVQELDGADGTSGGWDFPEPGLRNGELTARMFYRVGTGLFTGAVNGDEVVDVQGFVTAGDTDPIVDMPFAMVSNFRITAEVRGRIEFTISFKAQGPVAIGEAS